MIKADFLKPALLLGPLVLFIGVAYVIPFLGVMEWSVTLPEPGVGQYGKAIADPLIQSVFIRTFRICAIVTVSAVMAAYGALCPRRRTVIRHAGRVLQRP